MPRILLSAPINIYYGQFYIEQYEEEPEEYTDMERAFEGQTNGICGAAQLGSLLYTRQENEAWYPKIRLSQQIKPNDIDRLSDPVTIFRGCNIIEYKEKKYGQAWTTSLEIAQLFAYQHYQDQPWFDSEDRVVLKAEFPRPAIFYSNQVGEFEVVVDVEYLKHVEVAHNHQLHATSSAGA